MNNLEKRKWEKLITMIPVIDDMKSYYETLNLFYKELGENMLDGNIMLAFWENYNLDSKLHIDYWNLYDDIYLIKQEQSQQTRTISSTPLKKPQTVNTAPPEQHQRQTINTTPKKKNTVDEKSETMSTVDFYCFDVGKLEPIKRNAIPQNYEDADLQKDFAIRYILKGPSAQGFAGYEIPWDADYIYVGNEHIIETIPPKSESMGEYLDEFLGYSDEYIDQFIKEGQKGITIVTNIETGEIKVYPQYKYIPKYTISYPSFNDISVKDMPYDGNIEGILPYNIENVKSDNINRYKFLILLKKLLGGKKVLENEKEDKADNLEILKQVAYCKTVAIQLNMFFCKEVFLISDDGRIFLEDNLLNCFQYLPDSKNTSIKSYKLYLTKVCVNLATCLCLSDRSTEYDTAKKNALENTAMAEHYNLLELKKRNPILKEYIAQDYLLPYHLLQKLIEDYLCFENGYIYNYERLGLGNGGYYGEYYGMAPDKYSKKDFSWTCGDSHYSSCVLGCQKAFINKNKIFLGEYTGSKHETLGIEIEFQNMSYALTFRITPDSNRTSKLIDKIMRKWTLRQKVDYGRYEYGEESDYNRQKKKSWEETLKNWILQVQPKIHAEVDFEEKTIILKKNIKKNNAVTTIGILLDSIKKVYKECVKITEGELSIYSYFDEQLELLEQVYDWREDY